MRSFDTKGRRKEGKTREIFTSQLYQNEPIASNELGQLIGRQTLASATSAAGFPFLVGKTKNPPFWAKHRDMMPQDLAEACQSVKANSPCFALRGEIRSLAAQASETRPLPAASLSFVSPDC